MERKRSASQSPDAADAKRHAHAEDGEQPADIASEASCPDEAILDAVKDALREGADVGYPESVTVMLFQVVDDTLGVPKERRHAIQERYVGMVGQVVNKVAEKWDGVIKAKQESLDTWPTEKVARDAAVEAADSVVVVKRAALDAVVKQAEESGAAREAAERVYEDADRELRATVAELSAARKKRDRLQAVQDDNFNVLVEATLKPSDRKRKFASLKKFMEKENFGKGLVQSVPDVLLTQGEERSTFQELVLRQVRGSFEARLDSVDVQIDELEARERERRATAEQASESLKTAENHDDDTRSNMKKSKAELRTAEEDGREAHQRADDWPAVKMQQERERAAACDIREKYLGAFAKLSGA